MKKNYELWYDDEQDILRFRLLGMLIEEDVCSILPEVQGLVGGNRRFLLLADLSQNPSGLISKRARQAFKERAQLAPIDQIAVTGANPATRMIAKVALMVMGRSDTARFFKSEAEAITWLKGE
jgi:hypothetical protein